MRMEWTLALGSLVYLASDCGAFVPQSVPARSSSQPHLMNKVGPLSAQSLDRQVDTEALLKYSSAVGIQMLGITSFFALLDLGIDKSGFDPSSIPLPAILLLFAGLSLKSRVFNPLNNKRPNLEKAASGEATIGFNDRTMPSWTPPGITFPIMWVLIVAPLRAYSTSLVMASHGFHFCDPTILTLMLHLSIGDTWNTVNNVERRLGAAVPGIACVWLSVLNAARAYSEVDELAGMCLAATAVWITVAGALVADTWRVNNSQGDEPLYPYVGQAETTFSWGFLPSSSPSSSE